MNLIEELQKNPPIRYEHLRYLQESKLPLVLYGAADLARIIKNCSSAYWNIKFDFVVVDKEYWRPNMKFDEFDILTLEDVLTKTSNVNVVLAFVAENNEERIQELNKTAGVEKCVFLDWLFTRGNFDFILEKSSVFTDLYNCLADDLSRQVMFEYLRLIYGMSVKDLVKLNVLNEKQYFPDFLSLSENETFVDCGAYDGDTIRLFLSKVNGKCNKIFAFEPDPSNAKKCGKVLADCGGGALIEKGAWSEKTTLNFINASNMCSKINETGNIKIETDSIDNVCGAEKVSFIKMDIEGAELEALKGAAKQIMENKPKLAICAYHKQEDLTTIPQYLLSLNPNYKLYLRHYGPLYSELVLYAI